MMPVEIHAYDIDIENHTASFRVNARDAYVENINVNTQLSYDVSNQSIIFDGALITQGSEALEEDIQQTVVCFPNDPDHIEEEKAHLAQAKTE
jgi:hypothetical protein